MGEMKRTSTRIMALMWLLLATASTTLADPLPLRAGASFQALQKTTVKMLREDLSIEVTRDTLNVRAEFVLQNNGPRLILPVGFPCAPADLEVAGMNCKSDLRVSFQGKRHSTAVKNVDEYGNCWVWDMEFQAGESVQLDLEYSAPIVNERYGIPLGGIYFVYYPLRTGANWDGPIGDLAIHFRAPVENIIQITPAGYRRTPGLIEWHMENAKPVEDLFVIFDPVSTETYLDHISWKPSKTGLSSDEACWLATFALEFLEGFDRHLGMLSQLQELAREAPGYRQFTLPGMKGSEKVILESVLVMGKLARQKRP